VLKQFGACIAWFSGSVAGISAILYTLGFVATKAADQVLGIGFDFASHDPVFYVARGGSLVMRTTLISMWPALTVIGAAAAIRWGSARIRPAEPAPPGALRRWAGAATAPLVALGMIALAFVALSQFVLPALEIEGLLFADRVQAEVCAQQSALIRAVLAQDHDALKLHFTRYALCVGLIVGIGVAARSALIDNGPRAWLALAGVAGFLALVGTPIGYGALVVQTSPPDLRIEPPAKDDSGPMRLLSRSDGGVLVWLERRRVIQWISAAQIDRLTVGPDRPIATVACPDDGSQQGGG
jgi:hypothetical protein